MTKQDLIDPAKMNQEELNELVKKTDEIFNELLEEQKAIYKTIRGKLWLWWFIPVLGWIVYIMIYDKRKQKPENEAKLITIKTKIAEKQIQQAFNNRRQKQLDETVQ